MERREAAFVERRRRREEEGVCGAQVVVGNPRRLEPR